MGERISDNNPQPGEKNPSTTVGTRIFFDDVDSGRDYDSLTGKRSGGVMDPKDGSGDLKPTLVSKEAGAVTSSLAEIITGWNGNFRTAIQEISQEAMEQQIGTSAGIIRDGYGSSPVAGDIAASGSTVTTITMATGEVAAFAGKEGFPIEISAVGKPMRNYIKKIVGDVIHTAYEMEEIPTASGTVTILETFTQYVGGNQSRQQEVILAQGFGNGANHYTIINRAQSVGGFSFSAQNGIVKIPLDVKILSYSKTIDGRVQQAPMTIEGTYGRADVG